RKLTQWASSPPVRFFRGARIVAVMLGAAAAAAFAWGLSPAGTFRAFLAVVLIEMVFHLAVRQSAEKVNSAMETPSRELGLMAKIRGRLERESFTSPLLRRLSEQMRSGGRSATLQIHRLGRIVEALYWAKNDFARLITAPLLWPQQCAIAIEKWRIANGPHV